MCVCSIISPLAAVHSSQLLPVRTCEQYGGYTCPACVTAQVVEDLTSTYASGLSQMKYEYYSSQASLQRSKALFKEVNEAQKDAIRRVLSTCHVDASFIELITPILDITESLLPKQAETRQLDAECLQLKLALVVLYTRIQDPWGEFNTQPRCVPTDVRNSHPPPQQHGSNM